MDHAVDNLLGDMACRASLGSDPDWQELINPGTTKDKWPELFKKLYAKYDREIVGRAFRDWKYLPHELK